VKPANEELILQRAPRGKRRISLSRSQWMWATMGVIVAITIAALAFTNLREVYNSQKDFVVGLLASLAAVCFTKAFSRTRETHALELIREDRPGPVSDTLDEVVRKRLDRNGVFEANVLLQRNLESAQDRLSEYYHAQTQQLDFYKHAALLRVVISDMDKALANTVSLKRGFGKARGDQHDYQIAAKDRHMLVSVLRDLRESVKRKDAAYESLLAKGNGLVPHETWDVFAVLTGDVLKAELILESLLCEYIRFPPEEGLRSIVEYLDAALRRAKEFQQSIGEHNSPMVFHIMLADLTSAIEVLRRIDLPDAIPEPATTQP
jgi:hypothetical protein